MDWNKIVKAIGDYHGIECCPVETMEEADAQLSELYAKERHTPQEEKPAVFDWCKLEGNVCQYCKSHTHKCPNRIEVTLHDIAMKIRELQKPPATADMVETEFGEWLRIMSEKASYSDQREPVKAPADEGLVSREEVLKILRATMCEMACKDDMITAVYNLPRGHNASDKGPSNMSETHTNYEVSKRLKKFLGDSAPEPMDGLVILPYGSITGKLGPGQCRAVWTYQLHDLLSKPFTDAMFEKIGVVEMTDTDIGIEDDYDVFLKISYSYYEGGLPAVEKALIEMMEGK